MVHKTQTMVHKIQTMIHKTQDTKLKIEQHEPYNKPTLLVDFI